MPPRISRASTAPKNKAPKPRVSAKKAKSAKKTQSRSLNAFAIASHEYPDDIKVRRSRLGESDVGPSSRKRQRDEDEEDEEEDEEEEGRRKHKRVEKGRFDELDIDEGSDSEGNTWTLGHVDEDDDEDIDSDEAFGESDEERFEGWTFRGSASNQMKGKPKKRVKEVEHGDEDIDLDESDSEGEDSDDESLGEDAVDLATMLDQYEESDEEEKPKKSKKQKAQESDDDDEPSEEGYSDDDGASDFSMSDDDDEEDNDPTKIAQLRKLISSLPAEDEVVQTKGPRGPEVHESGAPSEFGVSRKVDLLSLKSKITDPEKRKALKLLQDDIKSSKRNSIARKLDAPLPKRQQDKLDRAAAAEKANETLGRWVETVKTNRRAEHLVFPLQHPNAGQSMGESKLLPTQMAKPANDLESTIQSILQESGLSTKDGKDDEENLAKWEELQTNKLPLEEVMARRAELRKQRELLFREEVRSKRIKKIKSKAYRRVHRKERERLAERERAALIADGVDLSEDEREYNDRRRAEERMGSKHRDSKWAKSMKKSGRTVWDDDAREGITEMARRNEELRRRIEGKEIRDEDEDGSDFSSDEDEEQDEEDDEVLKRQLGKLKDNPFSMKSSKLGSMAFMQKADAARKLANDEAVKQIQRDLRGEESNSELEDENAVRAGRRKFGPGAKLDMPNIPTNRNEFEEPAGSDEEDENRGKNDSTSNAHANGLSNGTRKTSAPKGKKAGRLDSAKEEASSENPYLQPAKKSKEKTDATIIENPFLQPANKSKKAATVAVPANPFSQPSNKSKDKPADIVWKAQDTIAPAQTKPSSKSKSKKPSEDGAMISAPDADGWQTVTYGSQDGDSDLENEGVDLNLVHRNHLLTAAGFAGDDVEAEFLAEKQAITTEDDTKTIDTTLPGWGTWTGSGLSTKAASKNKGKTFTTIDGIAAEKRRDAKLDRVIVNEKKIKQNTKFLASALPFPFENKEQYERSLRIPKGPEWTTKRTFQDGTKPRILHKGGVIRAMRKPMV